MSTKLVGAVERSGKLRVFLLAAGLVGRFRSRLRVSWPADPGRDPGRIRGAFRSRSCRRFLGQAVWRFRRGEGGGLLLPEVGWRG